MTGSRRELVFNAGLRPEMLVGFHSILVGEGDGGLLCVRQLSLTGGSHPRRTHLHSWTSDWTRLRTLWREGVPDNGTIQLSGVDLSRKR